MDKIMEKLNNLSLPAVILIASVILGGFYFTAQIIKQRSIERQQQIKIEQGKQEQLAKEQKGEEQESQTRRTQILLEDCLNDADDKYNRIINAYLKMIEEKTFPDVSNPEKPFNDTKANLQKDKDECFRKYQQR